MLSITQLTALFRSFRCCTDHLLESVNESITRAAPVVGVTVGVAVRVGVFVAGAGVFVRVGVFVGPTGVFVFVGVLVAVGPPPELSVMRSKSGAQPLAFENLIVLLLPAFRLTVVCTEPTVVQPPVTGKLRLLPATPLTLI